jgi:hypothetical protein
VSGTLLNVSKMKQNRLLKDVFIAYYDARQHKRNTINQLKFELDLEANIH